MEKPLRDETVPEADYQIPDNIRVVIDDIERRARRTYPDHSESRERMIRQELLNTLSAYASTCHDLGRVVDRQQRRAQAWELQQIKAKPWWKFWA